MNHTHERPIHNKNRRRWRIGAAILMSAALLAVSVVEAAQKQEYQTLTLVREYASKEEVHAAYPELFPKVNTIQVSEKSIDFTDTETGRIVKRMPIRQFSSEFQTSVTEADIRHAAQPIISEMVDRYLTDDHTMLVVSEGTITRQGVDDFVEGSFNITKNTLYDASGEVVTELPRDAGMVVVAPHTRDFVAYSWLEFDGPPSIYFYSSDGTLLKRQEIVKGARVQFSQHGKFVQVSSAYSRRFFIFTKTGEFVYQGDYTKLIGGVFVSEEAEFMLLSTDLQIYLYTTQGDLLWTNAAPRGYLMNCQFFSKQQKMALMMSTGSPTGDRYDVRIHSLTTGEKLDKISRVADIASTSDRLIIKKGGHYYEYQIH